MGGGVSHFLPDQQQSARGSQSCHGLPIVEFQYWPLLCNGHTSAWIEFNSGGGKTVDEVRTGNRGTLAWLGSRGARRNWTRRRERARRRHFRLRARYNCQWPMARFHFIFEIISIALVAQQRGLIFQFVAFVSIGASPAL